MPRNTNFWENWKSILTAIVGVLIVIPSLINAGNDIWIAWQGLPIGEKEKINSALFKKHFKHNPVHTKQIIVDSNKGRLPITIDVYENGDILVDYVSFVQWFSIESKLASSSGFEFSSSAHAFFLKDTMKFKKSMKKSVSESVGSTSKNVENKIKSGTEIERIRELSDGTVEKQIIDINTGEVKSVTRETSQSSVLKEHDSNQEIKGVDVIVIEKGNAVAD